MSNQKVFYCRNSGPYKEIRKIDTNVSTIIVAEEIQYGEKVVLKILGGSRKDNVKNHELRIRFSQEVQLLSKMDPHPNIVAISMIDEYEGKECIIQEYVQGETLEKRIDRGGISEREAIIISLGIISGLEFLWRKYRLTHRDLRPGNIIINEQGEIKILDFGLAFTLAKNADFRYRAPERAGTLIHDSNFKGEIYSLGVMIYEMLTGPLAPQKNGQFFSLDNLLSIDNRFKDLIRNCLDEDPEKRPSYEKINGILNILNGEPHLSPKEQGELHRIVDIDVDNAFFKEMQESAKLSLDGAKLGNAGFIDEGIKLQKKALKLAKGLNIEAWKNLSTDYLLSKKYEECIYAADKAIQIGMSYIIKRLLSDETRIDLIARSYTNKSAALGELGRHLDAISACIAGLSIAPNYSRLYNNQINPWIALQNFDAAEQCADQALEFDQHYIHALIGKGTVLLHRGQYKKALPFFERILSQNPYHSMGLIGMLECYILMGDTDKAQKTNNILNRCDPSLATEFWEKQFGQGVNPMNEISLSRKKSKSSVDQSDPPEEKDDFLRGRLLISQRRFREACDAFKDKINDSDNAGLINLYGWALYEIGKYSEAKIQFDRAYTYDPKDTALLCNYARYYIDQKDFIQAEKFARKSIDSDIDNDMAWANLGAAIMGEIQASHDHSNDRMVEALRAFEKAIKIHPNNEVALGNLFLIHLMNKDIVGAKSIAKLILDSSNISEHVKNYVHSCLTLCTNESI